MSLTSEELAALRQEYMQRGLRRGDVGAEPIALFQRWLAEAKKEGVLEPNAMVLSTVDKAGQPWSRIVLLKVCDASGFAFFTNYNGAKAMHLEHSPQAALTFWWGGLERQVNVTGKVAKTSRAVSEAYFGSRPRASQLGAWASDQSQVIGGRKELEERYQAVEEQFGTGEIPCPQHWGGYVLVPESIEFWQGRQSRLHDRFRFTRCSEADPSKWLIERLSP